MKFLHLSDLHIGLKLYDRDLLEDQRYILHEITQKAAEAEPDAVVIAGDLYDKPIPSAEAAALFDQFLSELTRALPEREIMMISGNHDSAQRINLYRGILAKEHVHMIGLPPMKRDDAVACVTLTDEYGPVHFYLLPFVKPSMVRNLFAEEDSGSGAEPDSGNGADPEEGSRTETDGGASAEDVPRGLSYDETLHRLIAREISCGRLDPAARNVLVSHQFYLPAGKRAEDVERMDSERVTVGNIDQVSADVLEPFDYAALGHIHKPMRVGSEFRRYCGTPLACSVSEAGQQKGILEVTLEEKGAVSVRNIPLTPLRQIRVIRGSAEEVLKQATDDYVQILLTDETSGETGEDCAPVADNAGIPASEQAEGAPEKPARRLDWTDLREQFRLRFPHLLEVRREARQGAVRESGSGQGAGEELDPYEACCALLAGRADAEELELLKEVVNEVQEAEDS